MNNLALDPKFKKVIRIPAKAHVCHSQKYTRKPKSNEYWKTQYFKKNPSADNNGDGSLSWAELIAHKKMPETQKKTLQNNHWKSIYLKKILPQIPTKMEFLTWPELHAHKKSSE